MDTKSYKLDSLDKSWLLVDASDKTLGRLSTNIAKILMGKNKPEYTPHNVTSAKESIQCEYEGENIVIGFNAVFLLEILKSQNGSSVIIKLENSLTAGIFISEPEDEEDTLTLLMPTRLNN